MDVPGMELPPLDGRHLNLDTGIIHMFGFAAQSYLRLCSSKVTGIFGMVKIQLYRIS